MRFVPGSNCGDNDCYAITTISLTLRVGVPQAHRLPKAYGFSGIGRTWVDLGVADALVISHGTHSTGSATRGSNLFEISTRNPNLVPARLCAPALTS